MARPKLGEGESKRLQMVITEAEVEAIDTWQHANRVPSRSEAIRRLIAIGLSLDEAAARIQSQIEGIDAARDRLHPADGDSFFGKHVKPELPPDRADHLEREISARTAMLEIYLSALLGRLDAFRNGRSLEEAENAAAEHSKRLKSVVNSWPKGGMFPDEFREKET